MESMQMERRFAPAFGFHPTHRPPCPLLLIAVWGLPMGETVAASGIGVADGAGNGTITVKTLVGGMSSVLQGVQALVRVIQCRKYDLSTR